MAERSGPAQQGEARVALLRWNLFSCRDLCEWINRPFDTPPESLAIQGELFDLDSILPSQT